jgi:hypothetical protein
MALHPLAGKPAPKGLLVDPIDALLTTAPGNGAPIGGLKVVTGQGWFAARPSGTKDVYKLYAEGFRGRDHLRRIQEQARAHQPSVGRRHGVRTRLLIHLEQCVCRASESSSYGMARPNGV